MAISANKLVSVLPRVITAGSSTLELNGIMISDNAFIPTSGVLEFYSSDSVGAYFGTNSTEYELSVNYFLGFTNSTKKPTTLIFARDLTTAIAGALFGGKFTGTLASLVAITDGTINLTIGTVDLTLTAIDFSSATSFSDVASILQVAIRATQSDPLLTGATVEYSSINKNFIITVGGTGVLATLTYATSSGTGTDLSSLLKLDSTGALFLSQGTAVNTPAENMTRIKTTTLNWVSFMIISEPVQATKILYSTWVNSQNNGARFVFICQDSDVNALVSGNETNMGFLLSDLELKGTSLQYNTPNISAFVMGMIASINFEVANGRITFAFKSQSGLAYSVNEDDDAEVLIANGYNFYGNYATNNDTFKLYQNSKVSGAFEWLDTLINAISLNDRLQTNILDLMSNINSLPYNKKGYTMVENSCQSTIDLYVLNGVVTKGITLSSTQKILLEQEAGLDISEPLFSNGYYMQVLDPGATIRGQRKSPNTNFWYNDGGSIQQITMSSTVIL